MRISTTITRTVCFLCVKTRTGFTSYGTGVFVGYPSEQNPGLAFSYFVTARHLLHEATKKGYEDLYVRLNKHGGGVEYVQMPRLDQWVTYGDDSAIDLTLVPVSLDNTIFQIEAIPFAMLAGNEKVREYRIGAGDEVMTVGLFVKRTGRHRSLPIMRTGNIAAGLNEMLSDAYGNEFPAYLIEVRSIGGLSGSPVFVYLNKNQCIGADFGDDNFKLFMIGIIRGHWNIGENYALVDSGFEVIDGSPKLKIADTEDLNTGIALVTPSHHIMDILTQPFMKEHRERSAQGIAKKHEPTLDTSSIPSNVSVLDFDNALKLASRKISESDPETKEKSE